MESLISTILVKHFASKPIEKYPLTRTGIELLKMKKYQAEIYQIRVLSKAQKQKEVILLDVINISEH